MHLTPGEHGRKPFVTVGEATKSCTERSVDRGGGFGVDTGPSMKCGVSPGKVNYMLRDCVGESSVETTHKQMKQTRNP